MKGIETYPVTPIPEDILFQIFQELPAKSLLRFKCVSKSWCSMIEDPHFVDAFRVRSHNRGTRLLVCKLSKSNKKKSSHKKVNNFFLLDSGGKSVPLDMPIILQEKEYPILQLIEGLICFDNAICNPTTRKITHLPPRNPIPAAKKMGMGIPAGVYNCSFPSDYLLGFDVTMKNWKVLSICKAKYYRKTPVDIFIDDWHVSENNVLAQVLTLGAHCWKNTNYSPPQELSMGFCIMDYCSINGIMYIIIKAEYTRDNLKSSSKEVLILTFDLCLEKFQLLPLPSGLDDVDFSCEIGGRFALTNYGSPIQKIWILEEELEFEGGKWTVNDIIFPQSWKLEDYTWHDNQVWVSPIGSNQSGEILFEVGKEDESHDAESLSAIFSYNLERKDVRMIKTLTKIDDYYITILPKFVENIHPLK